jgi:hypothetical protein
MLLVVMATKIKQSQSDDEEKEANTAKNEFSLISFVQQQRLLFFYLFIIVTVTSYYS